MTTLAAKRTYFKFAVIALCLMAASAVFAAAHAAPPPRPKPLTAEDRGHLLGDKFKVFGSVRAIPAPVRKAIEGRKLMGPSYGSPPFPIADPGKPYNSTDVVLDPTLPSRRLIFVAVSPGYCLIAYEQGGIGYSRDAVLYRLMGKKAKLTWRAYIDGNCRTLGDVRAAVRVHKYQPME